MSKIKLSIVIPVFNEEKSLLELLVNLKNFITNKKYEIVFINDGSSDNSLQILKNYNENNWFVLVNNKINKGYGGAIKEGIKVAKGEHIITIDADGQHFLQDIDKLYCKLLKEDADMVVGLRKDSSSSLFRRVGKFLIRFIIKRLMPLHIHDINSGMKIYDTKLAIKYIKICPDSMAFSDIIALSFIYNKHLVIEEPINIKERITGKSTITYKTALRTVIEIINIVMLFNPLKIFFPISVFLLLTSTLWGLQFIIAGNGVSVGALLGIVIGFLMAFLGLIAESICKLRTALLDE